MTEMDRMLARIARLVLFPKFIPYILVNEKEYNIATEAILFLKLSKPNLKINIESYNTGWYKISLPSN